MSLLSALDESDKGWTTSSRFALDIDTEQGSLPSVSQQLHDRDTPNKNAVIGGGVKTGVVSVSSQSSPSYHVVISSRSQQANMNFAQQAQSPAGRPILPQDHSQQSPQQRLQQQQQQPLLPKQLHLKQLPVKKQQQQQQQLGLQQVVNSTVPSSVTAVVKDQPQKMFTVVHQHSPGQKKVVPGNMPGTPGQKPQQQRQNFQQQQFHTPHHVQPNILLGKTTNSSASVSPQLSTGKSIHPGNLLKNMAFDYMGSVKTSAETASQILLHRDQQQQQQHLQQQQQQQYLNISSKTFDVNGASTNTQVQTSIQNTSNNLHYQIPASQGAYVSNIQPKPGSQLDVVGQSQTQHQQTIQVSQPGVSAGQSPVQAPAAAHSNQDKGVLSKPDTVIKSERVVLEGGGEFEEGQKYVIRDRQGNSRMMIWKGGQFFPSPEGSKSVQHSQVDSSQPGSGRGRGNRGRGRGQRGNRGAGRGQAPQITFLQQGQPRPQLILQGRGRQVVTGTSIRSGRPPMVTVSLQSSSPGVKHGQMLQFRPGLDRTSLQNLMPAAKVPPKQVSGSNVTRTSQSSEEQTEQEPEVAESQPEETTTEQTDTDDLPNIPEDPNAVAVCQFCGTTSEDKVKCESCKRRFNKLTRYHSKTTDDPRHKRRKLDNGAGTGSAGLDAKGFYCQTLDEQSQLYKQMLNSNNSASKTTIIVTQNVRGVKRGLGRGRGRGRGRGIVVPETVTISSDEEDGGPKHREPTSGPSTPVSKAASSGSKSPGVHDAECPESPLIPLIPISSKIDKAGCRAKMEDELGKAVNTREHSPSPQEVILDAHSVNVGTFRGVPIEPVLLSKSGLSFYIEGVSKAHRFSVYPQDIQQCLVMFDHTSTHFIFLLTSDPCGIRVRKDLGIHPHTKPNTTPPDPYFDPTSIDMTHQMVTLVLKKLEIETQREFRRHMELFKSYGKQGDESFFMELNASEADEILKQSTNKVPYIMTQAQQMAASSLIPDHLYSQHGDEEYQDDLSPPRIGFAGPIIKLLTYPPPPEKGGHSITNEDLYCLQQGEFLNDVIIDFYLKYLYLEKFSAADRARTHIFSSFFYKRLTQRIRGTAIDDDPCITLAVKRHARVKTWTRKLDLFSKDFIIIPINEHAHWFLAIVCFPGLEGPVENKFIPRPQLGPLIEPTNVPTPPQPTEETMEEETEESQDTQTQSQIKQEQSETSISETPTTESTESEVAANTEKSSDEVNDTQKELTEHGSDDAEANTVNNGTKQAEDDEKMEQATGDEAKPAETGTPETMEGVEASEGKEETPNEQETASAENKDKPAPAENESVSQGTGTEPEEKMDTSELTEAVASDKPEKPAPTKPAMKHPVYCKPIRGEAVGAEDEVTDDVMTGIRQPCIIIFDSLSGPSRARIVQVLKEYLQVEWAVKRGAGGGELNKSLIKGCVPKVPQQNNYSDCGVFMLQYVESFFEDPIQDFVVPMKGLHDWFTIPKIEGKREEIRDLIIELKEKYESKAENKDNS